jgi:transcriptional regulator with GAF, ATPase, and Fis domain
MHERKELVLSDGSLFIWADRSMDAVVLKVMEIAKHDKSVVMIIGKTGTGKEGVAELIHTNSPRSEHPFEKRNCAAIPATLLESELFGHEKGAYSGAHKARTGGFRRADKGTFFLDEIGDLPLELQAKLLRFMDNQEVLPLGGDKPYKVDARIISATNKNLEREVKEGRFREDLFFRLNVHVIEIPELKYRSGDILPLAKHFLEVKCREFSKQVKTISSEAQSLLLKYDWPGNVRELNTVIERLVIAEPEMISAKDVKRVLNGGLDIRPSGPDDRRYMSVPRGDAVDGMISIAMEKILSGDTMPLRRLNDIVIIKALGIHGFDYESTAKALRISTTRAANAVNKMLGLALVEEPQAPEIIPEPGKEEDGDSGKIAENQDYGALSEEETRERAAVISALEDSKGKISQAAKLCGMKLWVYRWRLKKYSIDFRKFGE